MSKVDIEINKTNSYHSFYLKPFLNSSECPKNNEKLVLCIAIKIYNYNIMSWEVLWKTVTLGPRRRPHMQQLAYATYGLLLEQRGVILLGHIFNNKG